MTTNMISASPETTHLIGVTFIEIHALLFEHILFALREKKFNLKRIANIEITCWRQTSQIIIYILLFLVKCFVAKYLQNVVFISDFKGIFIKTA